MVDQNTLLMDESSRYFPGGVNSPVRAFTSVGGRPIFVKRASGCYLWDENDDCYIDYVGSWGPAILGHAPPSVVSAVQNAASHGFSFGTPTKNELNLAKMIQKAVPSMEMMRFVSSGTEAIIASIRLARGYTKRDILVKFDGCFHGHVDALLVNAGSGVLTCGQPDSAGIPCSVTDDTAVLVYNDIASLEELFRQKGEQIAAVIVELVAGNMGLVLPHRPWLQTIRQLCTHHRSVLIADEIMTGFRVHHGGAQTRLGITPDLTALGKIVGGGMPLAVYGGRAEIMQHVAPAGAVYQSGTLSGHPIATAAGIATLRCLEDVDFYTDLESRSQQLTAGLMEAAYSVGYTNFSAQYMGGMCGLYMRPTPPHHCDEAKQTHPRAFRTFFHSMLKQGIYFPPSRFEAYFISNQHTPAIIEKTIACAKTAFLDVQKDQSSEP